MVTIRILQPSDWEAVRQIYMEGISTGNATFETKAPEWESWDQSHVSGLRFVAINDEGKIMGWAALTPVSGRCVYAGVAEVSVYIGAEFRGQKTGDFLLSYLIRKSEESGYWTLQAGIFEENAASIGLHQKHGFRIIGYREKLGKMNGTWRNVNLLERRSKTVGIK
ncbi:GNAT family N-acetyltransferase [Dyadobacter subterraneus]|uniref:N-acetyltransferase n=1 Tax=Dyadobacter subterraneus TaxID=2773304 RepID=A0ABR9WFA6_9BACT|nr:GNAT family N-acetyltransferase [Dyadobacter subterraneus]MBE9464186.1 N-acetyltransferase [Dyadobacter subterraneus]